MKKQKKLLLFLIILIMSILLGMSQTVYAIDYNQFGNVEYTEEYKEWLNLSEEEKEKTIQPRMYKIPVSTTQKDNVLYITRLFGANNISKYSLKDIIPQNLKIKDQGETSLCWTFAGISSLETNLALRDYKNNVKNPKVYDYSEKHVAYATSKNFLNGQTNPSGYNKNPSESANWFIFQTYLENGLGAVPESEMPFDGNTDLIDINELKNKTVSTQVYDATEFANYNEYTGTTRTEIINSIKQHIKNYGSVFSAIHGASSSSDSYGQCYVNENGAKYCKDIKNHPADHAVSIIGWDDNYAIENFAGGNRPTQPGAWIVRNSWGEKIELTVEELKEEIYKAYKNSYNWSSASDVSDEMIAICGYTIDGNMAYKKVGDNGIFYISYQDCNIGMYLGGIIKANDEIDYENIYNYDDFFPVNMLAFEFSKTALCTEFNKKTNGDEYITQVAIYAPQKYKCKVSVNPNGNGKSKDDFIPVELKAGETETIEAGYHTLEFKTPVKINSDKFVVAIEVENFDGIFYTALENKLSTTKMFDNAKIESGKCFITNEITTENNWVDLSKTREINSTLPYGDSTIKAFTVSKAYDESLTKLEIVHKPNKTKYKEGEDFDPTGLQVKAYFNSKTTPEVILKDSDYEIENGSNLKPGQKVKIKYGNLTVECEIEVEASSEKVELKEIKVTKAPNKTEYTEGENFDKTGMVVEAIYSNGEHKTINDYTLENATNLKKGQKITIKYNGLTIEYSGITVKEKDTSKQDEQKQDEQKQDEQKQDEQKQDEQKQDEQKQDEQKQEEQKPENFDYQSAKLKVNNIKYYTFTTGKKEYFEIAISIEGLKRSEKNDNLEYYYYLASSNNVTNIKDWVKIKEKQDENDKLKFTINTNDISNCEELFENNDLYLYVKEVAVKGGNQSVKITNAMMMYYTGTGEQYLDGKKIEKVTTEDTTKENKTTDVIEAQEPTKDTSTAPKILPFTGANSIIIFAVIIAVIGGIMYFRYKHLKRYIK